MIREVTGRKTREIEDKEIKKVVEENAPLKLIEIWRGIKRKITSLTSSSTASIRKELSASFYPIDYINKYYGRSFQKLNTACHLALLIAAHLGHPTAYEVVKMNMPTKEGDTEDTSIVDISESNIRHLLAIPFAVNNFNVSDLLERYISAKKRLNFEDTDSITYMNIGYAFLLNSDYENASNHFAKAASKGLLTGRIEHAMLIIDDRIEGTKEDIALLLAEAGLEGQWLLAKCHQYGWKRERSLVEANRIYREVIDAKPLNPLFYLEYADFCKLCAINCRDADRSRILYQHCIDYLERAGDLGWLYAYSMAQEVLSNIPKAKREYLRWGDKASDEKAKSLKTKYDEATKLLTSDPAILEMCDALKIKEVV